jgi:hypothetical protein
MKTQLIRLILIFCMLGCTKISTEKDTTTTNVKVSLDYKLTPRSDYMATKAFTISEQYQSFYTKYIADRLLTPTCYALNFTGINGHFKTTAVVGKWANKDLITLPEDTYIVSGKSWPKKFMASGDTCYLSIQDTIIINANTTDITLKATYDCYLILFDNSNIAVYSITESPMSDDPAISGEHNPRMMKTENFYHIFCVANNIIMSIETLDHMAANFIMSDYKFDLGKYYYFQYVGGTYNLTPMINGK